MLVMVQTHLLIVANMTCGPPDVQMMYGRYALFKFECESNARDEKARSSRRTAG